MPSRSAPGFVLANSADKATKMTGRALPARNRNTPAKALGLETERGSNGRTTGELNMEQRTLGHCGPRGTDFGIPTDHRDQVGGSLTSFIFCDFQDDAVNVNPDASISVLRAFDEFQCSKALVCVVHFHFLQPIDESNSCPQLVFGNDR